MRPRPWFATRPHAATERYAPGKIRASLCLLAEGCARRLSLRCDGLSVARRGSRAAAAAHCSTAPPCMSSHSASYVAPYASQQRPGPPPPPLFLPLHPFRAAAAPFRLPLVCCATPFHRLPFQRDRADLPAFHSAGSAWPVRGHLSVLASFPASRGERR